MTRPALALMAALAVMPANAQATDAPAASNGPLCQEAGSDNGVIEGRLRLFEGLGPAAFIVTLPGGVCLTGSPEAQAVGKSTTVQLYAPTADGMQQLYGLVGKRVVARGKLTAGADFQQKSPILMEVLDIAVR